MLPQEQPQQPRNSGAELACAASALSISFLLLALSSHYPHFLTGPLPRYHLRRPQKDLSVPSPLHSEPHLNAHIPTPAPQFMSILTSPSRTRTTNSILPVVHMAPLISAPPFLHLHQVQLSMSKCLKLLKGVPRVLRRSHHDEGGIVRMAVGGAGRREEKEWSGEWNRTDMEEVMCALRALKAQ